MESEVPKQYLELHGKTILQWSLRSILSNERVRQLVVCVAENDTRWASLEVNKDPRVITALGGGTRAESVFNGLTTLQAVAHAEDWVLVHDAARPCLSSATLAKLIIEVGDDPIGGILAVPCQDTLKQAATNQQKIRSTLAREHVWQAQTPQMFRYGLLYQALSDALNQNAAITDEASAIERAGLTPALVSSVTTNIKVTTAEDLIIASAILRG